MISKNWVIETCLIKVQVEFYAKFNVLCIFVIFNCIFLKKHCIV